MSNQPSHTFKKPTRDDERYNPSTDLQEQMRAKRDAVKGSVALLKALRERGHAYRLMDVLGNEHCLDAPPRVRVLQRDIEAMGVARGEYFTYIPPSAKMKQ